MVQAFWGAVALSIVVSMSVLTEWPLKLMRLFIKKKTTINNIGMIEDLFRMNCSTLFLLHPLGLSRKALEGTGFCNCYLRDENKPEYEGMNVVLLLFHVKSKERFNWFVAKERVRTNLFIDEYDYDEGYVVLVYEFPEELAEDFERFKLGKYSEFSEQMKSCYPTEQEVIIEGKRMKSPSIQHMIVERVGEWKDIIEESLGVHLDNEAEYWQVPRMLEENLTIPPKKIAL